MGVKDIVAGTEHEGQRRIVTEPKYAASIPSVVRRRGRPTDIGVFICGYAPHDPCGCISTAGYPRPTHAIDPHPTTVVKNHPAKGVITHPHPIVFCVESPVTIGHVRGKVGANVTRIRYPDPAVLRIIDPAPVGIQVRSEDLQRARISVFVVGRLCLGGRGCRIARGRFQRSPRIRRRRHCRRAIRRVLNHLTLASGGRHIDRCREPDRGVVSCG